MRTPSSPRGSIRTSLTLALSSYALILSGGVAADVSILPHDSDPLPPTIEQEIETNAGTIAGPFQLLATPLPSDGPVPPARLLLDNQTDDDGITAITVTGPMRLGGPDTPFGVTVTGVGATLTAAQGIELAPQAPLGIEILNGGAVVSYGAIHQAAAGVLGASHVGSLRVAGEGSSLSTIATAQRPTGGRLLIDSGDDYGMSLEVLDGGQVSALSETGPVGGAGTVMIGGNAELYLEGAGSQLAAQYQITMSDHTSFVQLIDGAALVQLQSNGGVAPGFEVRGSTTFNMVGDGSRIETVDHIQIGAEAGDTSAFYVVEGAAINTATTLVLGSPNGPAPSPGNSANHKLELISGGMLNAVEVVVNRDALLQGSYSSYQPELYDQLDPTQINADLTLNGGALSLGNGDVDILGDLDARDGELVLPIRGVQSHMTVAGTALFGEGSLIRILLESVPAGGEVLLDRYLVADQYDFTPQFLLSAQLRVEAAPGLLTHGEEVRLRFSGLDQTAVFRAGDTGVIVPELNGGGVKLSLALMLALLAWRRERPRCC